MVGSKMRERRICSLFMYVTVNESENSGKLDEGIEENVAY